MISTNHSFRLVLQLILLSIWLYSLRSKHGQDENSNKRAVKAISKGIICRGGSRIFFRRGCTHLLLYFNTNKPHSFFFFCRIPVVLKNHRSSHRGGGHPLHPPPRSAPGNALFFVFFFLNTHQFISWMSPKHWIVFFPSHFLVHAPATPFIKTRFCLTHFSKVIISLMVY